MHAKFPQSVQYCACLLIRSVRAVCLLVFFAYSQMYVSSCRCTLLRLMSRNSTLFRWNKWRALRCHINQSPQQSASPSVSQSSRQAGRQASRQSHIHSLTRTHSVAQVRFSIRFRKPLNCRVGLLVWIRCISRFSSEKGERASLRWVTRKEASLARRFFELAANGIRLQGGARIKQNERAHGDIAQQLFSQKRRSESCGREAPENRDSESKLHDLHLHASRMGVMI